MHEARVIVRSGALSLVGLHAMVRPLCEYLVVVRSPKSVVDEAKEVERLGSSVTTPTAVVAQVEAHACLESFDVVSLAVS